MGQILIRRLDDSVIAALKERASLDKVSVEALARGILTSAIQPDRQALFRAAREFRARQAKPARGPDTLTLLRQTRRANASVRSQRRS
jgi:plasmid stability protein